MKVKCLIVATICGLLVSGCDSSTLSEREKREKARREEILKKEAAEKKLLNSIMKKYDAIYFPPSSMDEGVLTYELQRFFKNHFDQYIVFKGHINDVEEADDGIIVNISCPLGYDFDELSKIVLFRLKAKESQVKLSWAKKRVRWRLYTYGEKPDCFTVAKTQSIYLIHSYKLDSYSGDGDTSINVREIPKIVSTGELIEIVSYPELPNDALGPDEENSDYITDEELLR